MRAAGAAWIAALTACTGPAPEPEPEPPVEVRLVRDGSRFGCRAEVAGKALTEEALLAAARGWRERGARVVGTPETPYKCLGGTIFILQRAGIKRVGFVAEPPPTPAPPGE